MLADIKPDIVAICSRNIQQHAEMAIAAAEAGVRGIFMEKPFVNLSRKQMRLLRHGDIEHEAQSRPC